MAADFEGTLFKAVHSEPWQNTLVEGGDVALQYNIPLATSFRIWAVFPLRL